MATLQSLVPMVIEKPQLRDIMMLYVAAYVFLLRVPSEGLPMAAHASPEGKEVPIFSIQNSEAVLWFPFRKNKLYPSQLVRPCWCRCCPLTCPVHALGRYMQQWPRGSQPFAHIPKAQALLALRELLSEIGVPDVAEYGTKGFRRGHAEDLRRGGGRLAEILGAGDWSSAAFRNYLDMEKLESDRVAEAHGCLTDSEDSDDEF